MLRQHRPKSLLTHFVQIATIAMFILTPSLSYAKVFRNAYISFEMPDSWNCKLEQTEWVCRSEQSVQAKEAVIILTAKEVGPTDSFPLYDAHLKAPMPAPSKSGENLISKVQYPPKNVNINDQPWIDGLHAGSEVKNYYTRYLATIKDKIAILVTFSAHQNHYAKYAQDFFKTIQSLRVIATKELFANRDLGPLRPGSETLGAGIAAAMPGEIANNEEGNTNGSGLFGPGSDMMIGGAILLLAIGGYIFTRMRKNK